MSDEPKKKYLNHQQVALVFAVEPRTITKWVNDLGMPKAGRGEYDLVQCVQWRCNYLEKKVREAEAGGAEGITAKARINIATARKKELELQREERQLVNIDEVMPLIEQSLEMLRTRALTYPKHVAPTLEGVETNSEREEILKENIRTLLNELTSIPDKLRSTLRVMESDEPSVQHPHAATAHDRQRVGRREKNAVRRDRKRAG